MHGMSCSIRQGRQAHGLHKATFTGACTELPLHIQQLLQRKPRGLRYDLRHKWSILVLCEVAAKHHGDQY